MNTSCDSDPIKLFATQAIRNADSNEPLNQPISSVGGEEIDVLLEMEQEARKFICTHKLEGACLF
jgi:hypothetical protein